MKSSPFWTIIFSWHLGTPGTGKSTLAKELSQRTGLFYLDASQVADENDCIEDFDDELQSGILDEDRVSGENCNLILSLDIIIYSIFYLQIG